METNFNISRQTLRRQKRLWAVLPLLAASCWLFAFTSFGYAAGSASGFALLRSPSARPFAMADAYASVDGGLGGVSASFYNPAASAFLTSPEVSFLGEKGMLDDQFGSLLFGMPSRYGAFGAHFSYFGLGDIDLADSQGNTRTVKAEQDLSLGVNYGRKLLEKYSLGANLKFFQSKLVDSFSATAFGLDLGGQGSFFEDMVALGVSVSNVGTTLKYLNDAEPLPITVRAGLSHLWNLHDWGSILVAGDLVKVKDDKIKEFLGLEYTWNKMLALRGGYKIGQDSGQTNFGMGFFYSNFELDYGISGGQALGWTHAVSAGMKFGAQKTEIHKVERLDEGKRYALAILNFDVKGVQRMETGLLTDKLILALGKKNMFSMIGKKETEALEQQYGQICIEPQCAVTIGKALQADKVLVGSFVRTWGSYVLRVKLIDVSTGKVDAEELARTLFPKEMSEKIETLAENLSNSLRK